MSSLEEGIYFVRRKLFPNGESHKWEVAEYRVGLWHFISDTDEYQDIDIAEVGERVIKQNRVDR